MAESCTWFPKVRNKDNQVVDSKLFKDLLEFTDRNRPTTKYLYQVTKSDNFVKNWNPKLELDENGEPTLNSLIQKTNINKYIPRAKVLEKLNRRIGYYKKGQSRPALWVNNAENNRKLSEKALNFNRNSEFRNNYVANVIRILDHETNRVYIGVKVTERDQLHSLEANKMEYNASLNEKLRQILQEKGISVGVLDALEEKMGINGVTDFDQARAVADGMIELIRIAHGIKGEKALPEEFAHFAIEAMGEHPLITRLMKMLSSPEVVQEILKDEFDTYNVAYNGDVTKLAKEAAGKLLAQHLLNDEPMANTPYKGILSRLIQAIKNFFRGFSADNVRKAIIDADKTTGEIARGILNGSLNSSIKVENIVKSGKFYNLAETTEKNRKLLERIVENETKRLHMIEGSKSSTDAQQHALDFYEAHLQIHNYLGGIYSFVDNALGMIRATNDNMIKALNVEGASLQQKAEALREARDNICSFKGIIEDVAERLMEIIAADPNNTEARRVKNTLDEARSVLGDLHIQYSKSVMPLVVDFLKPFLGENIVVPFSKYAGMVLTVEDLLQEANEDISFCDRWLDSMADSSDYMLKLIDQAVKKSKELARLTTIDVERQLKAAAYKLEQAGVRNTDFMFERDEKGNLTGNYISSINWGRYVRDKQEFFDELDKKYGEHPTGVDEARRKKEITEWFRTHQETVNKQKRPSSALYMNPDFAKLTASQKEYYDTIMEIKAELDSYLPEHATTLNSAVKIRKDLLERVKDAEDVKAGARHLWEAVKDNFVRRCDDTDFGTKETVLDFEGREMHHLPIYYTKMKKGENPNDLSTDVTSTMIAYAAMANDYNEMNKIIDALELTRDLMRQRRVVQNRGGKTLVEKFSALGREVEKKLTKSGSESRILERLDDFFEMQVYGRYMKDEGTLGNTQIDVGKAANFVNVATALNTYALNLLSGISNVATGNIMMKIESFCKEFFSESDILTADKVYATALPEFLGEIGNRIHVSKLALWNELFNVMQEYEADVREVDWDRKNWFQRMFKTSSLYFMNNAGEHWMQTRTSLALAQRFKMKGPDGKTCSLWDAMEVVPIDENNKKLGAELRVKEGYIKEDGTAFTKDDIIAFSRKSAAINQRMHGIYNKLDRSAVQSLAVGRMGIMFRKWIRPALNRRFKNATYNFDLQAWTEGYYKTTGRFLSQCYKELRAGEFDLIAHWNELTDTEKANIKRAATEVGCLLVIALAMNLLAAGSDDKDRPWLRRMAEYQARRLFTEIGVLTPTPWMVSEGLTILKSPAAGINTTESALGLIALCNPLNYECIYGEEALVKSGRFKGKSRAERAILRSPLAPGYSTIYKWFHPEGSIPFYKQYGW